MVEIIGTVVGVMIGLTITLPLWVYLLAFVDLFFTFVKEGEAKNILKGEEFYKTVFAKLNHMILDTLEKVTWYNKNCPKERAEERCAYEMWDIVPIPAGKTGMPPIHKRYRLPLVLLENMTGTRWIGIPPFFKVDKGPFRWSTVKQVQQPDGTIKDVPYYRDEIVSSLFIKDYPYYGVIKEAEAKGELVPLDVEYIMTVYIVNPMKARFNTHRWLDTVMGLTAERGRTYVGEHGYTQLVSDEGTLESQGFSGGIQTLEDDFERRYGVIFIKAALFSVKFAGERATQMLEASIAPYLAEQAATAVRKKADGDAYAITAEGNARAGALTAQGQALKDSPEAALALENETRRVLAASDNKTFVIGEGITEAIGKFLKK